MQKNKKYLRSKKYLKGPLKDFAVSFPIEVGTL